MIQWCVFHILDAADHIVCSHTFWVDTKKTEEEIGDWLMEMEKDFILPHKHILLLDCHGEGVPFDQPFTEEEMGDWIVGKIEEQKIKIMEDKKNEIKNIT